MDDPDGAVLSPGGAGETLAPLLPRAFRIAVDSK